MNEHLLTTREIVGIIGGAAATLWAVLLIMKIAQQVIRHDVPNAILNLKRCGYQIIATWLFTTGMMINLNDACRSLIERRSNFSDRELKFEEDEAQKSSPENLQANEEHIYVRGDRDWSFPR